MIAIDTNILVYADRSDLPRHKEAVAALRKLAEGDEAWALPVFCTAEFVRVVSHARIFDSPRLVLRSWKNNHLGPVAVFWNFQVIISVCHRKEVFLRLLILTGGVKPGSRFFKCFA